MDPKKTDQSAPHAGEREKGAGYGGQEQSRAPSGGGPTPRSADRPASRPTGPLHDRVATAEGEGQAQPQTDELRPEERPNGNSPLLSQPWRALARTAARRRVRTAASSDSSSGTWPRTGLGLPSVVLGRPERT
jgi:hypothetical protein